jgi:GNAT superfamily N-acetyltransferase
LRCGNGRTKPWFDTRRGEVLVVARPSRPGIEVDTPTMPEGIYDLPPGTVAAIATYLEMRAAPDRPPLELPAGASFQSLAGDLGRYRRLYGAIGRDWLWFSRAGMSDRQLGAILDHPAVDATAFVLDGHDLGLIELDYRMPGECELAFLGLTAPAIGRRLGDVLVAEAVRRAFSRPIRRLWLHTCTLDHPGAVPFYMRAGFEPYRRAVEVVTDPRLTGAMPRDAAPRFPIV